MSGYNQPRASMPGSNGAAWLLLLILLLMGSVGGSLAIYAARQLQSAVPVKGL
jgi:hypothetical protein